MKEQRLRWFAYLSVCLIGVVALAAVGMRYVLPVLLPFVLSWVLVMAVRPVACRIAERIGGSARVYRTLLSLLLLLLLLIGLVFLAVRLGEELWRFLSFTLEGDMLAEAMDFLLNPLGSLLHDVEGAETLSAHAATAVGRVLGDLLSEVAALVPRIAEAVPRLLLFLLVCGISTVYIGWDLERVNRVVLRCLPERHRTRVCAFRARLFSGLLPYARSYLILMLLTFAVVSVGLALLGVEYVLLLSALIALLDALPVIGVGTVLIPWSLFELLLGRAPLGVGLLVLYVIHELIRQIAEPRILGRNMGLHPLLTLILLYGGYTLLGFLGLLLLPVLTVTLHAVMRVRSEREGEKAIAHDRDAPPRT